MLIKRDEAKIVDLGSKVIHKYVASDKQLEINYMYLKGRTPDEPHTFLCETKVHFMVLVMKGEGKLYLENEVFDVTRGDALDVPAGAKFAAEGDMEYITAESPAWYEEQATIVDKDGNLL